MAPRPESADFHERLGIEPEASPQEVKKAFRTLTKEYHPDVGGDEESFKRILEAKEVLAGERPQPEVQTASYPPYEPEFDSQHESDPQNKDEHAENQFEGGNETREHEGSKADTPEQGEDFSDQDTANRIDELREELREKDLGHEDPVPPDREPPHDEGGGGGGGGGGHESGSGQWSEWYTEYDPCPTCYHKLRYLFIRCPQCKGKGGIPKRSWHRVSDN